MEYAISNWIYGNEPLEKTLARLQRFGYVGLEPTAEPDMDVARIKALVGDFGLKVTNLLGNWSWELRRDLCNPDPKVRAGAIEYAKRAVELAHEFGALSFGVVASAVGKRAPLADREDELKWAVDAVSEVAVLAEKLGVYLGIETVNRYEVYLLNTTDQIIDFVRRVDSPAVKILMDFFHLNIEEPDPVLAVFKAGDLICNIHIADSNRQAVGNGHTDFQGIVRALKQIGYRHYLTLEPVSREADPTNIGRDFTPQVSEEILDIYAEQSIKLLRQYEAVA
jgi:D-psicose/D-tagatose/L-ribulose 3-epimerase